MVAVEAANHWPGSICQIGICHVESGEISETWQTMVNPQIPLGRKRIRVHGDTPRQVERVPVWSKIYPEVQRRMAGLVVSHESFDRNALQEACHDYGSSPLRFME